MIGADGVHSLTRTKLPKDVKPVSSGMNASRFLTGRQQALYEHEIKYIAPDLDAVEIWDSSSQRG